MRKLLVAVLAVVPSLAFAGIVNSAHDFQTNTAPLYFTGGSVRLCSYCHTAHHAPSTLGLWNRDTAKVNNTAFSGDTTTTSAGTTLPQDAASLRFPTKQCLSCHDGSTAINETWNAGGFGALGNTANGNTSIVTQGTTSGGAIGFFLNNTSTALFTSLAGTHPVSTDYRSSKVVAAEYGTVVQAGCVAGIANCTSAGTHAAKVFVNAASSTGYSVECASCHDPHYGPGAVGQGTAGSAIFLRYNAGMSICLSCHIK